MYTARDTSAKHGRRADTPSVGGSLRNTPFASATDVSPSSPANLAPLSPLRERLTSDVDKTTGRSGVTRSRRAREIVERDRTLEESWSSLNFFNRKHQGRISPSVEREGGELEFGQLLILQVLLVF